ncbi:MAG: sigma-54-dependent Fis family transcriptional regulator [Spirochaetes bacterium]|nr:sigma-54-dependent Fis family transcriptional regulator [Spirochaetota bacterium]
MPSTEHRNRILIIDSDRSSAAVLERYLADVYDVSVSPLDHDPLAGSDPPEAELVILDIDMQDRDGLELLSGMRNRFPNILVIIITASADVNLAVQAMKLGAYEYLTKPVNTELVGTAVKKALSVFELKSEVDQLRDRIRRNEVFSSIIGGSEGIGRVLDEVTKVMTKDVNVLLLGESGTGKELVARAIHSGSRRRQGPFVVVNCAAITTELADSLLFGHKKGSFTGAFSDHDGFFAQAHGGTIFLDEIGDMDMDVQAKVLRVIEDKRVRKVGDSKEIIVDFRIVSATNRDFKDIIARNEFRSDLYYRLEEYPVKIPPLRERRDDIPLLAHHFLDEFCKFYEIPEMHFGEEAMRELHRYEWPGNIRELKNVIQRAAVLSAGEQIDSLNITESRNTVPAASKTVSTPAEDIQTLEELEREAVERAYRAAGGNPERACLLLGISRATLYRKLKRYNIR